MSKIGDAVKRAYDRIAGKSELRSALNHLGKVSVDRVRIRTRLGRGVDRSMGGETALRPLKDSTKKQRKKNRGGLSGSTSPGKSNLTETGKMLDSMNYRTSTSRNSVDISFYGSHGKISNKGLAAVHNSLGAGKSKVKRPFFKISAKDYSVILTEMRRYFRDIVRRSRR